MARVFQIWQAVKQALAIRSAPHGFFCCEEKAHPEAFGSRYVLFRRGPVALRLVWDGKDEQFRLEHTEDAKDQCFAAQWQEIGLVPFAGHNADNYEDAVLAGLMSAAERFVDGFREEPARPITDLEGFYRSIRCLAVQLRCEGHAQEADRLGMLMSCAWTTGSELIGELASALEDIRGAYSKDTQRLISECLHFAKHHRRILGLD
jgi:hypothetical protein